MNYFKKNRKQIIHITEYLISGGAWFWSGYALFAVLYGVFTVDIVPAKIVSYVFGLTVNFLLQRYWVFARGKKKRKTQEVTGKYVVLSAVNLGIDTLIVWSLDRVGLTPYLGQFVSAGFFTAWNYAWYRLWIFDKRKTAKT